MTSDRPASAMPPLPKAPGGVQTYSEDPSTGVWHYLGDAERKGKDIKGKEHKGEAPKGEDPKEKDSKRKDHKENAMRAKKRIRARKKLSLVNGERATGAIIPRIRHGAELGTDGRGG